MKSKGLCSYASKILSALALVLISSTSVPAQQEKILHTFIVSPRGTNPQGNLIADAAGNLYGTTQNGGVGNGCATDGCGIVFELTRASNGSWMQAVLHNFGSFSGDGAQPAGGVIFDAAGNLYGTTISGGSSASSCGTVFKLSPGVSGRWTESILYSFAGGAYGCGPATGLVFDQSGNLYGPAGQTVFELTPSSTGTWTETVLYTFSGQTDGSGPNAVVLDQAGNVYGSTVSGGNLNCNPSRGCGVVFELIHTGNAWSEKLLHTFAFSDGASPLGNLIFDADGGLYGTTQNGPGTACGGSGCGTVFRMMPRSDGSWVHMIIHTFDGSDGASPAAGLTAVRGAFFGTTQFGGTSAGQGFGTVFELTKQHGKTWTEQVIHRFGEGGGPVTGVIFDSAGNLYGSTPWTSNLWCSPVGGGCGAVFQLAQSAGHRWKAMQIYAFQVNPVGAILEAGLIADHSGNFYGTASSGGTYKNGSVFELTPKTGGGWNTIALHAFARDNDGSAPVGRLTFDGAGNLYGTTSGALGGCYGAPCGTVFRLTPYSGGWKESVLYQFKGVPDGSSPYGGVVLDDKGNIYGTTTQGGSLACGGGCGTVFKLSLNPDGSWTEELIHVFQNQSDGESPQSSLVLDDAGNLYGTTVNGGGLQYGDGTVFRMTANSNGVWDFVTLYTFTGKQDGGFPVGVTLGTDGDLYGVTYDGGNSNGCNGSACGTVFRLSGGKGGWTETVLHSFQGGKDGAAPVAAPTFDPYGNLYGTATTNGSDFDCGSGTVYELSPGSGGWTERVLHNFGNYFDTSDGSCPWGGVILDESGNIFGTTAGGGTDILGTIFELSSAGEPFSSATAGNVVNYPGKHPNHSNQPR
jgi:uncharacterized repeat protein (TIGR03803 family)